MSISEAWSILDKLHGQNFDNRNKLRQVFMSIKDIAKLFPYIELDIIDMVQKLAAMIKAASALSLLECYFEYVKFISIIFPDFQKENWIPFLSL